ncbi:LysR substrate-binding domain-containing protein [uncultured Pseudacidovorax sp.]|uniref:LysR substrate-binding domain-containing protein n=1 Tax=uncultured Pseudacidovorax sp. TaxID=679313 RepID=UPI0025F46A06|nr:LysR substrate-binding domain-containing protein [uncultured Pseudacidovorax sp.]
MGRKSPSSAQPAEREPGRGQVPPLNALRSFEAVATHGSFAAAAATLNVTHWAVGKQIRLLEQWFGKPLFERRARGVQLTAEGATLLADVSDAFDRLASGAGRLRDRRPVARVAGTVKVNALVSFALSWLLPRLPDFHRRYPDVDVRVSTTSRRLRYVGDAFDIGVRSGPEQGAGLVSRRLMADERLPACSPALLRDHPIGQVEDLRRHTLLHSASTRGAWAQWLREAGVPRLLPERQMEFEHVFLQQAAAVEGLGVALVSLPLVQRDLAAGRLVCPLRATTWRAPDYTLVLNTERESDAAVSALRDWMLEAAAQEQGQLAPG